MEEAVTMDKRPFVSYMAYIPANVRHHELLSANAKVFYAEITALSQKEGYCFASNAYFAEQFKMSDRTVSRLISELEEYGFISVKIVKNGQTGKVLGRRIYPDIVADELIPEGKIITLNQLTKLSEPVDNIFHCQSSELSCGTLINNNKKIINTGACTLVRKETAVDAAAREQFKTWAHNAFGDEADNDLIPALMAFCDIRLNPTRKGKKSNPVPEGRAVTTITNKLIRFSDGRMPVIIALLDKAIEVGWDTVYPLKEYEITEALRKSDTHGEDGGEKWV